MRRILDRSNGTSYIVWTPLKGDLTHADVELAREMYQQYANKQWLAERRSTEELEIAAQRRSVQRRIKGRPLKVVNLILASAWFIYGIVFDTTLWITIPAFIIAFYLTIDLSC